MTDSPNTTALAEAMKSAGVVRKAHTETREGWTPAHRDNDARRVMTKALVEDLWKAWRQVH